MERRWGFVPCQVRISTTWPWHTCGARAGRHWGPGWGQRGWDWLAGAEKHQPGKSFLMLPSRSALSLLGEGRQQEQACPHLHAATGARRGRETWLQFRQRRGDEPSVFPWCPGVP